MAGLWRPRSVQRRQSSKEDCGFRGYFQSSSVRGSDGQRTVENCQANDLGFGHMRTMSYASGGEKEGTCGIGVTGLLPLARKHVNKFVCLRMDVSGNRCPSEELAQDRDSTGLLVLMERKQF